MSDQEITKAESFANAMNADPAPEKGLPDQGESTPSNPNPEKGQDQAPPVKPDGLPETDWKKRYDDTKKYSQELNSNYQRTIDVNAKLVEKNPDLLSDIAENDSQLADQISEKLHGVKYADYQEKQKLDQIKDSNPDAYDAEVRLRNLEKREAERQAEAEASFFESKGIKQNTHDSKYNKVMEQLEMFNPNFVETNRERALEMAYNLAYPNSVPDKKTEALVNNTSGRGGNISPINQPAPIRKKGPKAQAFSQAMADV